MKAEKILLTGANGFIGRALCPLLSEKGYFVRCALREKHIGEGDQISGMGDYYYFKAVDGETEWKEALNGINVVIHLAARVHVLKEDSRDPLSEFRKVNLEGTKHLAESSAKAGARRFVFISSIKVNGEHTTAIKPFSEKDSAEPQDGYAISKWEAEKALRKIEAETGMEVVIIRPPLVYGPGVKANFLRLLDIVYKGLPLPFAGIENRRSFIALDNLVDAIALCAGHLEAGGQTFLVSDGEDLSTPDLICRVSNAMGKPTRLFPFPPVVIKGLLKVAGKGNIYERLWGSLVVDSGKIRQVLGWEPPVSVDMGIKKTVDWYLNGRN